MWKPPLGKPPAYVTPAPIEAGLILSDHIALSRMAQAMHDGPLGADDHEFSAARPQGAWCLDMARAGLAALRAQSAPADDASQTVVSLAAPERRIAHTALERVVVQAEAIDKMREEMEWAWPILKRHVTHHNDAEALEDFRKAMELQGNEIMEVPEYPITQESIGEDFERSVMAASVRIPISVWVQYLNLAQYALTHGAKG